jgi:hypothetical protein
MTPRHAPSVEEAVELAVTLLATHPDAPPSLHTA